MGVSCFAVGGRSIGDRHSVFIVGETAWAHEGSTEKLQRMIAIAADASADAINFHMTHLPSYIVPHFGDAITTLESSSSAYQYLEDLNLAPSAYGEAAKAARKSGLLISAMINDRQSLDDAMEQMDPDMLMIHPSSIGEVSLLTAIAATGKPLNLYVGGLTLGEVEQSVQTALDAGAGGIMLQHGFQSYPTPLELNNLRYIETLKRLFECPIAFGDHTDGADPYALVIPSVAVAAGANVIEKHLTPDRSTKGEDFESALDGETFGRFVENVRKTEAALGEQTWRPLSERELGYRKSVRKRLVAREAMAAGTILQPECFAVKRATNGLYPEDAGQVLGLPLARDVQENEEITADLVRPAQ